MQLSIVHKLSISSFLLVLFSSGIVGWVYHKNTTDILVDKSLQRITVDTKEAGDWLKQVINSHNQDVLFLANTPPFQGILRTRNGKGGDSENATEYAQWIFRLGVIFESLLERKKEYYKIRFINENGNELISVYNDDSKIIKTKKEMLQNKNHRPYVAETLKLEPGEVYISDINLNREYGKVTDPINKVYRIATPIHDERSNEVGGLIIITVKVGDELREIQQRANKRGDGDIYITNNHGGYLLHPDDSKTYGFDLKKRYRVQEDIPQLVDYYLPGNSTNQVMLRADINNAYSVVNFEKIALDTSQPERFIAIILTQKYSNIVALEKAQIGEIVTWVTLLALTAAGIGVVFSFRLTRPIRKITSAINCYGNEKRVLENLPVDDGEMGILARSFTEMINKVEVSKSQLNDLNANLELIVNARTKDLNAALSAAEQANQAKSEFLSRMSHELRTPMNAILGFGQLLELDADGFSPTQKQNVAEILLAGDHLLNLINDVLDLAKIESGKFEASIKDVFLNDVLQGCLALISPQLESLHLRVIDNVTNHNYVVRADFTRLKQVMLNILSNAVKYNGEYGKITLTCEIREAHRLRISISDTGDGLSEADIGKLFTSFERLNQRNNVEGAGIGLVITKHLIEIMGGSIDVECKLGEGCTFHVELELADKMGSFNENGI